MEEIVIFGTATGGKEVANRLLIMGGQNKYDVITAFHVIEHLQDPLAILQQLTSLLT